MTDGIDLIRIERERQLLQLGYTPDFDDGYVDSQLAQAARCYLTDTATKSPTPPPQWPWHPAWWKPSDDPVRNLEKAGALIAAEIDRRRRAGARSGTWQPMIIDQEVMNGLFVQLADVARPWAVQLEENLGLSIKRIRVLNNDGTRGDVTHFTQEPMILNCRPTNTLPDLELVPPVPDQLIEILKGGPR